SGIRRAERTTPSGSHPEPAPAQEPAGAHGRGLHAVQRGALLEMRPILMACLAAGLGLLPAAISTGIGAQAQQPLARVVVGAMITTALAILVLIPIFASFAPRHHNGRP
ncbi:MAG TPA: efflux RND transporter permease subunit, partial [Gemmatimonadales bacterium]|nr:efflux RND transporter permease subunit [Gemmatimonadales bacterium]